MQHKNKKILEREAQEHNQAPSPQPQGEEQPHIALGAAEQAGSEGLAHGGHAAVGRGRGDDHEKHQALGD